MSAGQELIDLAVKIELECAALYEVYARCFSRETELAYFWRIYAEAERYHAATIRIHQYSMPSDGPGEAGVDAGSARSFLTELQAAREAAERSPPSVKDALARARWAEESSAELHGRTQFFQGQPDLAELFQTMAEEDRSHRDMLANAERRWASA